MVNSTARAAVGAEVEGGADDIGLLGYLQREKNEFMF
jgi:hypothetical protein